MCFSTQKSKFEILTFYILSLHFQINVFYDLQHIYILHSIQSSLEMNVHKSLPLLKQTC